MAPPSRFGASKFRNAAPYTPSREEWYRGNLPFSGSSTSASALTTFTSELKTNRQHIVTLSPAGDLTYRTYDATGQSDKVGSAKVGSGTVGDWDLSRLEGGQMAVGGTDGSVNIYSLPASLGDSLQHTLTISGTSPVTHVAFHPTTPDILLVSTTAVPASIYDLSSTPSSPTISLNVKEPKGLWSITWSPDGRKIAAIGRSGTAYIWDPRSNTEPLSSRALPLQPIKPSRIVYVGDDLFVTGFSKTRNREFHLFSGSDLSTVFTNSVDTSTGLLLPVVDQERKIIYLSAKGDMSLRQIEIGGSQGYQETIHPLSAMLSSPSIALAHPTTLPVMSAQIATVLLPQVDKDGDTILPLGIRVPRRQLIDFHDDLYPEIFGPIPEQSGQEWISGSDKLPLFLSLDPSRRSTWEKRLSENSPNRFTSSPSRTTQVALASTTAAIKSSESALESPGDKPAVSAPSETSKVTQAASTAPATKQSEATGDVTEVAGSRPSLKDGETYSSTEYKGRIMGDHIAQQLQRHREEKRTGPLMVGLQGPQGCGKTTLCNALLSYLQEAPRNLKIAVLSLDDLYKTNQGLKDIAAQHPDNQLLSGRGPPGTHDPDLATRIIAAIQSIQSGSTVDLPIFDKSLCGGEGDRSTDTVKVVGPLDVFILEGWSMGFGALPESELKRRYESKQTLSDTSYFLDQPLSSLITLNTYLSDFAKQVYRPFTTIVQIEPESYKYVFDWRLEQERNMKASNGGKGMSDEQVHAFVERYMPGYELWKDGIWASTHPWAGRGLRLWYGKQREVIKVDTPEAKGYANGDKIASVSAPAHDSASSALTPDQTKMPASAQTKPAGQTIAETPRAADQPPKPQAAITSTTPAAVKSPDAAPTPKSQPASSAAPSAQRYNPNWSRKFLAGKSPLIPLYDQIPALSTLHQDSQILRATSHLVFFPVRGPGGRIGVHPLSKKGRMVTGGEGYLSGGVEVTDFAIDPFTNSEKTRVALAGEDGIVRIWSVGKEGVSGVGTEPELVLKGQSIDKIAQVLFHPTAKDLLVLATNDAGKASIRLFNLSLSQESLVAPLEATGVFNIVWSLDGSRLAAATKDGRIVILDPRDGSSATSGKAHDSPRSFQPAWISDSHLVSVGFSRGSQRRINLYKVTSEGVETIYSLLIDVSPSVLFPVYDPDTCILYVWGKGERQIQAYEVHPENPTEPIAKIPSYTSGTPQLGLTFLPKTALDVKKVEVAKALRLTAKTIEEVTFTIPRNKPDFFQDDIYVDTDDVEHPSTTADEWLNGENKPLRKISLKPEGMTPLSQAPQTQSTAKAKFVPAKDILSEEEKKRREMDALFAKAKMDESSDEDDEPKRTGLAPPDDDW